MSEWNSRFQERRQQQQQQPKNRGQPYLVLGRLRRRGKASKVCSTPIGRPIAIWNFQPIRTVRLAVATTGLGCGWLAPVALLWPSGRARDSTDDAASADSVILQKNMKERTDDDD